MKFSYISSVLLSIIFTFCTFTAKAQYLSVDPNYTAEQLVRDVFFGNQSAGCISINNIVISGQDFGGGDQSFGYFHRDTSNFEMEEGILLTTGILSQAVGPNSDIQSADDGNWLGDQDLENALNIRDTSNATVLEFDFTTYNATRVSFEYLFASEQYLRNNDPGRCDFTDGFAFLIKEAGSSNPYRNLAVIPGTDIPIKSNTVRGGGEKCEAVNEAYFGHYNPDNSPTNFNGQTKILNAVSDVTPGVTYHLKLVIADQGNGLYDSGVFLKAGGFMANKDLGPDRLIDNGTALCEDSTFTLDAETPGATYEWYKDYAVVPGENSPFYTVSEPGFYEVVIDDAGCKIKGSVLIEYAAKPITLERNFCNYNDGAPIPVNLQNLNNQIITNLQPYFQVQYFADSALLQLLPNEWSYTQDTTIYAQIISGDCTPVVTAVQFNTPVKSLLLQNQSVCAGATATLEVENTFIYYKWMRENGEIITEGSSTFFIDNAEVGKYVVELTSANGCKLEQEVTVSAAALPLITNIAVAGSTATVSVSGGSAPYEYSLDNITFQGSGVFSNVPRGLHTVYVRDAKNCGTVSQGFLIINLINAITPNDDGKNDVLNYSDLQIKENVKITVFDRYGMLVYASENKQYIWDGKMSGRPLPSGTYWYTLYWTEPDTQLPVTYNGYILLKNRN